MESGKLNESDYEDFDELPDWQKEKIRKAIAKRRRRKEREERERDA